MFSAENMIRVLAFAAYDVNLKLARKHANPKEHTAQASCLPTAVIASKAVPRRKAMMIMNMTPGKNATSTGNIKVGATPLSAIATALISTAVG